MSNFLRDRYIKNVMLNPDRITAISQILTGLANEVNRELPEGDPGQVTIQYMIRFDNKGFILDSVDAVLEYHKNAKFTERINFALQSQENKATNSFRGKSVDLRFDAMNEGNCSLRVQDDESDWTDSVFCRLDEEITKYGNKNYLIRSKWTPFFVQILGVVVGFSLSLWAALRISPMLNVQYAFVISFVLAFLIFSNIWAYLNEQILLFLNFLFPNISFKEDRGFRWLGQTFIGAVLVAVAFFLVDRSLVFLGGLLNEILK